MGASSTKAEASSLQSQSQSQSQTPEAEPEWADSSVFSTIDASELFAVFRRHAHVDSGAGKSSAGVLNSTAFAAALHELRSQARFRDLSASSETFAERLFHVLDADHNGVLDVREFLHGLGLLTRGSLHDKIRLSFDLFDANGDGRVSRDELMAMIRSSFLAAVRTLRAEASHAPQTEADVSEERERADQVARTFTREAFATLGTGGDDSLCLDDFERFAATAPAMRATLNGRSRSVDVTLV
jgi:Ca2+-binding EF-hand superfamily protein